MAYMDRSCEAGPPPSVSPIMATTSSPASPEPLIPGMLRSTSPDHLKGPEVRPPVRPKSTPFPQQEPTCNEKVWRLNDHDQVWTVHGSTEVPCLAEQMPSFNISFANLPTEIHEFVLDHLFGVRGSIASTAISSPRWSTALRHSRRKQLSDLALVNRKYRTLVQGRLFKHIKIQGTRPSIEDALFFLSERPHLQKHPRHIEVWSPVWERRPGPSHSRAFAPHDTLSRLITVRAVQGDAGELEASSLVTSAYQLSSKNASLYEIFQFIDLVLPDVCIMTLEGGHCKKPPKVQHFPEGDTTARVLPELPRIRTLVLKSAWNIMRTEDDFRSIMSALPKLREWHSSYAKPKSKSYLNISRVVPQLPSHIRHLNISLEATYSREAFSPRFWHKVYPDTHICVELAKAIPQLESFTYCGRICHHFFQQIMHQADPDRRGNTKLKSIDLTVKNCCRPSTVLLDGSGINDSAFISALETLVIAGICSLSRLTALQYLSIRFVDIECPMPLLNPFFQMKGNRCSGLWSERILSVLAKVRPATSYVELSDDFGGIKYDKEGKLVPGASFPRTRPLSMKVASYDALSNGILIV